MWKKITFVLDETSLTRRVVPSVRDFSTEISASSPVGQALLDSSPGQVLAVRTPAGVVTIIVTAIVDPDQPEIKNRAPTGPKMALASGGMS
jgi:transcription elongation GreA/GreB family factor